MSYLINGIEIGSGSSGLSNPNQLSVVLQTAVPTAAGSGVGAAVVTAITGLELPASYTVLATPNQDAVAFVSGKSQGGFSVTLNPRLAANTLAAGTIDLLVLA